MASSCNTALVITGALYFVLLTTQAVAYKWLKSLEHATDCGCAADKHQRFFRIYLVVVALHTLVFSTAALYRMYHTRCAADSAATIHPVLVPISAILLGLHLVFMVYAFRYVKKLKSTGCSCALRGIGDNAFYGYAWFLAITYGILGVVLVVGLLLALVAMASGKRA